MFSLSSSFAVTTRRWKHVSDKGRGKWRWAEKKPGRSKQGWISQVNRHPLNSLTDTKSDKPLPRSLYSRFLLTTEHVSSHERKESSIFAYKRNGCDHAYSFKVDTLKERTEAWLFNSWNTSGHNSGSIFINKKGHEAMISKNIILSLVVWMIKFHAMPSLTWHRWKLNGNRQVAVGSRLAVFQISEAYSIVIARIATSSPRTILFCIPSWPHPKQISVEANIIGWSTDPKALRLTKRS